ncbi:uncharacterized protein LOC123306799 [Coccinella septempunctata]|uniref:uncharacterized protein LOC123306799 n=1 Tax=Coccinella septempunctata TaxID=41139 RepID=UPI001D0765B8|nr:uncharacterized protein LOC123306799 [Coccinella septempunctata]
MMRSGCITIFALTYYVDYRCYRGFKFYFEFGTSYFFGYLLLDTLSLCEEGASSQILYKMKNFIFFGICFLLVVSFISQVESDSICTSNCDNGCNSDCSSGCNSDCSTGCKTNCQTPCRRKCKTADCRSKCDVKEPEEPEVQKTKETIVMPSTDAGSKTSNVNDIKNDYSVDINPNITLTNSISNMNKIDVPINVTSVNVNNIRVSSSDSRSSQTNITTGGGSGCSGKNPPPNCIRNQKQIVIIPYPQRPPPQIVTPPPQPRFIVQPIVREPIIVQAPQTPSPPPQRIPIIVPTPIIQQNPVPVQPQPTIVQPMPQYYWFSQQYIRQPQQTIITPQQQVTYSAQSLPCGAPGGQCGSYCLNQPCSTQNQQIIPMNYPIPTAPCQSGGCGSRMMYAITSPYISSNQASQYIGIDPFYSRNGIPQFDQISSTNGLSQNRALYNSRNVLRQNNNMNSPFVNQIPVGVDSYFIPDQFSRYQIQGGNSTEFQRKSD